MNTLHKMSTIQDRIDDNNEKLVEIEKHENSTSDEIETEIKMLKGQYDCLVKVLKTQAVDLNEFVDVNY
jgi:hypothetical protein